MAKGEKKERKKSGKADASKATSPAAENLTPEGRIKKVMELTCCSEAVAEMVLLNNNNNLELAVLAVLDRPKDDVDSWKEVGKVRKSKKQNDAEKDKFGGQGNRRADVNRVRNNPNETRVASARVARDSQGPRQQPSSRNLGNARGIAGRNMMPRQNERLDDRKSLNGGLPPVELENKDERDGPLVFEKTVPPSPTPNQGSVPIQILAPIKSDKPTFAEIAANKKTMQPVSVEPKIVSAPNETQGIYLVDHNEFTFSGGERKPSTVHSVASKSPPYVSLGSAPQEMFINEEYTEKLKTDIGMQTPDQMNELAARVKSLEEDGQFFVNDDDESKANQFCSLEDIPSAEMEKPHKKVHKPLMLSYINATMVSCPPKKEVTRVDKQTEVMMQPIAPSPPFQQQQPIMQNFPSDFQQLTQVQQQIVTMLAAQLAQSMPINPMVSANMRETQAPLHNVQVPTNSLDASQSGHMQGRMIQGQHVVQGQQMIQGQQLMHSQPRVDNRGGGMFGWQHQQPMGSQSSNQARMGGAMEVPPGFVQAYPGDYQAMTKMHSDQQVSSSFEGPRVMHGGNLPQMQMPNVNLMNAPQRPLAGHGFPQNYGFGMGVSSGGTQQMPQSAMGGTYGGPYMHNFQHR